MAAQHFAPTTFLSLSNVTGVAQQYGQSIGILSGVRSCPISQSWMQDECPAERSPRIEADLGCSLTGTDGVHSSHWRDGCRLRGVATSIGVESTARQQRMSSALNVTLVRCHDGCGERRSTPISERSFFASVRPERHKRSSESSTLGDALHVNEEKPIGRAMADGGSSTLRSGRRCCCVRWIVANSTPPSS